MKTFTLNIITPENLLLEQVVTSATLPLIDGEVTILPEHEAYIGICKPGAVVMKDEKGVESVFATSGGFIEFHGDKLMVLVDTAESAEAIDVARAEEAKKRAEKLMEEINIEDTEAYERTAAMIEKEMNRIRVGRHRSRSERRSL